MTETMADRQEARVQLDAVRSAMADPLKRWASEPHQRAGVPEVVAALSELIGREAAYQRQLEQVVLELEERVVGFSEAGETITRAEQIQRNQGSIHAWDSFCFPGRVRLSSRAKPERVGRDDRLPGYTEASSVVPWPAA